VKAPSTRLRYDSLPAHTDQTRIRSGEAGNRTQSDIRCGVTLALTGSSYGETEPRKATHYGAGHNTQTWLNWSSFPPHLSLIAVRVQGIQWLNWLHLTELSINRGNE